MAETHYAKIFHSPISLESMAEEHLNGCATTSKQDRALLSQVFCAMNVKWARRLKPPLERNKHAESQGMILTAL